MYISCIALHFLHSVWCLRLATAQLYLDAVLSAATFPKGPMVTKIQTLKGPIFCLNTDLIQTQFWLIWKKIQTSAALHLSVHCCRRRVPPVRLFCNFVKYLYWYRTAHFVSCDKKLLKLSLRLYLTVYTKYRPNKDSFCSKGLYYRPSWRLQGQGARSPNKDPGCCTASCIAREKSVQNLFFQHFN